MEGSLNQPLEKEIIKSVHSGGGEKKPRRMAAKKVKRGTLSQKNLCPRFPIAVKKKAGGQIWGRKYIFRESKGGYRSRGKLTPYRLGGRRTDRQAVGLASRWLFFYS